MNDAERQDAIARIMENEPTICCQEEDISVHGNCSAVDDETDRAVENWIARELDNGNPWAWCFVTVEYQLAGFVGRTTIGCCSFPNEQAFKEPGSYYDDMKREAASDLLRSIEKVTTAGLKALRGLGVNI